MKKFALLILLSLIVKPVYSKDLASECISGDCINGFGTKQFLSGSKYAGQFKNGKENGQGIYYFFNGSRYEGEFENGNFHGQGKLIYSTGIIFNGDFSHDTMTSRGDFSQPDKIKYSKNITSLIPDDIDILMKFPSLSSLFRNFSIRNNTIFGMPINFVSSITKKTGLNPLSIWDLRDIGIDTNSEFGFAISDLHAGNNSVKQIPVMNIVIFIPVTDGSKLISTITKSLANQKIIVTKESDYYIIEKSNKKERAYLFQKSNYIFIAIHTAGDAKSFIKLMQDDNSSLQNSRLFNDAVAKFTKNNDPILYFNINNIIKNNQDSIKNYFSKSLNYDDKAIKNTLKLISSYANAVFSIDLESKNFLLSSIYTIKPQSKALEFLQGIKYNKKHILDIDKKPLFLMLLGLNIDKYYQYLRDSWPQNFKSGMEKSFLEIKNEYNINVPEDIIKNIGGNINIGIFDSEMINPLNYNTLFTLTINNSVAMDTVLKKIAAKLPEQSISREVINGVNAYVYTKDLINIYIGIKNNVLVIAQGKDIFESALNVEKSQGFITKLEDKDLQVIAIKDNTIFYIDVDETLKVIKNFGISDQNISADKLEYINKIKYLLISSNMVNNSYHGQILIKTNFTEPFFITLKDIIQSAKNQKKQKFSNEKKD